MSDTLEVGSSVGNAEVISSGSSSNSSSDLNTNVSATPNPVVRDFGDDDLVRHPSLGDQPVKYGELYKRLQADYTRKNQLVQKQRETWEAERQSHSAEIANERKRLEGLASQLLARQNNPGQQDEFLAELSKAQYIDGPTAAKMIQTIQQQGFAPVVKAFQERDQIIQGMYSEILNLRKQLTGVVERFGSQDFDGKIDRLLQDGGYPAEAKDLAKEIYLAYEGDNLDEEFPTIFQNRWNQLQTVLRKMDQQRVAEARNRPRLPGKGGNGVPGKSIGLRGNESSRQVVDALWETLQNEPT